MRDETLERIKEMIRGSTGIIIHSENSQALGALAEERILTLGLEGNEYPRYLEANPEETVFLASRFTVQETSFYRYREHFDRLKLQVLPELIRRKQERGDRRLSIVSAGCATGEEPYTIAMILHDLLKDKEGWEVSITATDINEDALRLAREGQYSAYRLRNIDPWYVYRYFDSTFLGEKTQSYRIKAFIKSMVEIRQSNLIGEPFPLADLKEVDIVFCENVIIYFCMESIQKLINRFFSMLRTGGYLFLGHSETLNIITHNFELSWWNDSFAYRKPEQPAGAAPPLTRRRPAVAHFPSPGVLSDLKLSYPEIMYLILQNFETGEYVAAAALLRQAEKSGAVLNDVFHVIKAEYLYENHEYIIAANECRQAIAVNSKSTEAHLLLGAIYLDLGMPDNARFEINTALYHEPESPLAYYYLGRYYESINNPTENEYCLSYARHLLEKQGNVMTAKTFPLYRERRTAIYAAIQDAVILRDVPRRPTEMGNVKEYDHGR